MKYLDKTRTSVIEEIITGKLRKDSELFAKRKILITLTFAVELISGYLSPPSNSHRIIHGGESFTTIHIYLNEIVINVSSNSNCFSFDIGSVSIFGIIWKNPGKIKINIKEKEKIYDIDINKSELP